MGDPLAYLLKSFVALMDHDVMSWDDLEPQFIKQVHLNTKSPGLKVIKLFSCSTQLRLKFILLINVKMPTIVGILTFMSWINY